VAGGTLTLAHMLPHRPGKALALGNRRASCAMRAPARCRIEKKVEEVDARLAKLKQQISAARTPAAKNAAKGQAMRLLKQKKAYLAQLDQVGAQQLNLESANFMAQQMKDTADQARLAARPPRAARPCFAPL
jgi:Snf7